MLNILYEKQTILYEKEIYFHYNCHSFNRMRN